jgi:AcrR family transcriptional regulator
MARPVSIDDRNLLRVAREIFLERGVTATTSEIARRAGIAQGSIFRRFKSKADLFKAALFSESFPWMMSLRGRVATMGLKDALIETGPEIIALYRKVLPVMMMGWSHRRFMGTPHAVSQPPAPMQHLHAFFEEQMTLGRIRQGSPRLLAAAYVSPLMTYALVQLTGRKHSIDPQTYVAELVQVLWAGIAPTRKRS